MMSNCSRKQDMTLESSDNILSPRRRFFQSLVNVSGLFLLLFFLTGAETLPKQIIEKEAIFYRSEGQRFQEVGDLDSAEAAYRKAVIVQPNYAEAYNDLGVILESRKNLEAAEGAYRKALQTNPKLGAAHSNLALLYERAGKVKEAGEHWAARVRIGPPDDPWIVKARQKLIEDKLPIPLSPEEQKQRREWEVKHGLEDAEVHMRAKRWEQVAEAFRRVLDVDPGNRRAIEGLQQATAALEKERSGQGRTSDKKKELEAAYQAGQVYLKAKRWDEAITEFEKVLSLDPNHKGAAQGLKEARAGKDRGRLEAATKVGLAKGEAFQAMDSALLGLGATGQAGEARRRAEEARRQAEEARRQLDVAKRSAEEAKRMGAARQVDEAKRAENLKQAEASKLQELAKRAEAFQQLESAKRRATEAKQQAEAAKQQAQAARRVAEEAKSPEAIKEAEEAGRQAEDARKQSEEAEQEGESVRRLLGGAAESLPKTPAEPVGKAPLPAAEHGGKTTAEHGGTAVVGKEKSAPPADLKPPVSADVQALADDLTRDKTKTRLQTVREIYQRGVSAMRQGKYQEAISHFEQVLVLDASHPEAQQGLKRAQAALAKSSRESGLK